MSKYTKALTIVLASSLLSSAVYAEENEDKEQKHYGTEQHVPPAQPLGKDDNLCFFVGAAYTFWAPYNSGLAVAFGIGTSDVRGNTLSPAVEAVSGLKLQQE